MLFLFIFSKSIITMITIAIMNQKGGVGKTTTCINLAAQSAMKQRTLVVDCDKQANLSQNFGIDNPETSFAEAMSKKAYEIHNVRENLDLLPANVDTMLGLDFELHSAIGGDMRLKKVLAQLKETYDVVFLDCPPDVNKITINALVAADYIILPVKASEFSLRGIDNMIGYLETIKEDVNPDLVVLGILITQYNERLKISRDMIQRIKDNGWDVALFDTKIRMNTALDVSQSLKKTIFEHDKKSNGAMDYMKLGMEINKRIKNLS